ncbi:MAG: hypothetical protein V5A41_11485 [Haloarculaceae archaeon]
MSRRRVLAAIAAAGGAGALTGSGAGAFLRDDIGSYGRFTSGIVDIVVDYWQDATSDEIDLANPDGTANGPRLDIPVSALEENASGAMLLRISLPQDEGPNNPASVWLRTVCPPPTTLGEFLTVALSYSDEAAGSGQVIADGSLRDVADALRGGVRLDGDPTTPDVDCLTDDLFVVVEYSLGEYIGDETTTLQVDIAATQCRHADPTVNPFGNATPDPCDPGYRCDCCWAIGKVEVDDRFEAGTTYDFTEGLADYAISVTDVDGDSGVAFELVATDDAPLLPLCEVQVKGGPPDERYTRTDGEFGFETSVLDGTSNGLVYAPENPNNGGRYAISYVLVKVCVPRLSDDTCPADIVEPARRIGDDSSGGSPSSPPDGDPLTPSGGGQPSPPNDGKGGKQ